MVYKIYTVRDALVGYNAPFIMVNEDVAKREFRTLCEKKKEVADDLSLWEIGSFDDETGTIIPLIPEMVKFGKE